MDPAEIDRLAEKERQKSKTLPKAEKAPKPFVPSSAESWKVYTRIYPHYVNVFIWVFLIFTAGFICLVINWSGAENIWLQRCGWGLAGLTLIRYLVHFIVKVIRFSHYRNWRRDLGFEMKGWDQLGKQKDFPKRNYWLRMVTVDVQVNDTTSTDNKKTVNNAVYLLIQEANKCFYESDGFGGEPRKKWMFNDELKAAGSANAAVVGEIYLFIDHYLRSIQNSYPCIKQVEVKFEGEPVEVNVKDTGD